MDLFESQARTDVLGDGAVLLGAFALDQAALIIAAVNAIAVSSPFRHLVTPGGHSMSVGMTNCGPLGWVSDRKGYRYTPQDPLTSAPWPPMPTILQNLATRAALAAGFENFMPDACLINRYLPGAKMSLHQDKDEKDMGAPIVSVSLGLPATFQFSGMQRSDPCQKIRLAHGDVVVWGGPSRLAYHGILPLKEGHHPLTGAMRINLTFRKVN